MNYPTGYEAVNIDDEIKGSWLHLNRDNTWEETIAPGCRIGANDLDRYCRPIKHHDPKYWDLSPLSAHRFLTIGEEIKNGDHSYKNKVGPWGLVPDFMIGDTYDNCYVPICRPIEQPNKESNMLVLELETLDCKEVNSSLLYNSDIVFFRIKKQSGFIPEKSYVSSVGPRIKSSDEPQYSKITACFFIRGRNCSKDNDIIAVTFEQFEKIEAAVKEILERENKPKFIETLTFNSEQTGKRHKVNVIKIEGNDLFCVDCDTNEKSIFSASLLKDIQNLPNAF